MILLASVEYLGLSLPYPKNSLCCIDIMFGNGNGKEWEKPYGNPMEWELVKNLGMGMGRNGNRLHGNGSGNVKSHSRASLG